MRIVAPIPQQGGQKYPQTQFFLKTKKTSRTQKKSLEFAKICKTSFDRRSLIHREAWFPSRPRIPQNPNCFKNGKKAEVSNPFGSVVSTWFCQAKSAKNCFFQFCYFRPLPNKNVQILDHFFPLLFPKDSESLKILDI